MEAQACLELNKKECEKQNIKIACGKFGAMMDIESIADGPVNFILKR